MMNRTDLINKVSEVVLSRREGRAAVDCMLSAIAEALNKEEPVTFLGFGSFRVVRKKARHGRNPRTGETMVIPAHKVPKFTPAKALKETVNTSPL
jgi:nucleoid DNA-binding protein